MQTELEISERACRQRQIGSNARNHQMVAKITFVAALGICVLAVGCRDVVTTWLAEARSPDGHWVATARTQQWGGPGTAYDATTVYLKKIEKSDQGTEVLVFSHQYATMNLDMKWVTATRLEVTYGASARPGDHVHVDYQIARISGIDITVHELPREGPLAPP